MLTGDLAIADYQDGRILPDRLTRSRHAHYLGYAERMLHIYGAGAGCTRQELHRAVHAVLAKETECPVRRIEAFCKLLDDASTYDRGGRGQAAGLRRQVFRSAAAFHPLLAQADRHGTHAEAESKTAIAAQLGRSWEEIDRELFADVMEFQRLQTFAGYADGAAFLARYNVAQIQAALFRAVDMVVWATEDFKTIVRYAKLARLMHSIRRQGDARYELRLDGPASALRRTRRYGVALAQFLPALIACRGWQMHARLQTRRRGWLASLDLSAADQLSSHLPAPEEFDSRVEENFARNWGEKREGWSLLREGEILHERQKVFVPDFVLRHDDGRRVLLEIVGFWTSDYLTAKLRTLQTFRDHAILLAVADTVGQERSELAGVIRYKTLLRPEQVLARLP